MALIQIPLRNDSEQYDFTVDLEGRTYTFEVQWNSRSEQWSLIIYNDRQEVLLGGIPLNVNSDLLGRFVNEDLPPGALVLFDQSGAEMEATRTDLGTRCILLYSESVTL